MFDRPKSIGWWARVMQRGTVLLLRWVRRYSYPEQMSRNRVKEAWAREAELGHLHPAPGALLASEGRSSSQRALGFARLGEDLAHDPDARQHARTLVLPGSLRGTSCARHLCPQLPAISGVNRAVRLYANPGARPRAVVSLGGLPDDKNELLSPRRSLRAVEQIYA